MSVMRSLVMTCKGPYVATLWTIFTFARRSLMTGWACTGNQQMCMSCASWRK